MFTAAQAAQKEGNTTPIVQTGFTAAQAAQKTITPTITLTL